MTATRHAIRSGAYYDSIVLMQLQRELATLQGVLEAGVVMATPTNLALLSQNNLLPAGLTASANDLLIVVQAEDASAAEQALARVDELLSRRRSLPDEEYRPRSLEAALRLLPEAGWVLVSVPGRYAAGVTRQALELERNVFLYSDNVALEDEVALKDLARARGKLLMGPDCGTAIVAGTGLGFANRVRRGAIGLLGASGTGLQAVAVHVHALGEGISHALGTGGRDLSAEVGAATALQALHLLARDPQTQVIAIVSKPPDPQVAARFFAAAQAVDKPVVVHFQAYAPPARTLGNLHFAATLREAAELAVSSLAASKQSKRAMPAASPAAPGSYLRGLFSGGTLAAEALVGLRALLAPLYANLTLPGVRPLENPAVSRAHTILDMGADEFTVGRLHPMIDNDFRLGRLRQEADDPEVGVILLDVVLGEGAHPDPAAELAPAIASAREKRDLAVMVILIGTAEDPQDAAAQARQLSAAGATIFESVDLALDGLSQWLQPQAEWPQPPVSLESLASPLAAINVGLESFHHSLSQQRARAVQVDWRPPAGGDERLMSLLAKLG